MDFDTFKAGYLKEEVEEHPHNREGKSPLVTIRVIAYNHARFIRECLDSLLAQETTFDFEILIGEDESNDGTREICIEYAERHPDKIRLFLNSRKNNIEINNRPSGLFNCTYANFMITSKYMAIIEADDFWTDKHSLQKRVMFLEEHDDFVICFHNSIRQVEGKVQNGRRKFLVPLRKSKVIESRNFIRTHMPTSTIVLRNGLVDKFDEDIKNVVITDIALRCKLSRFGKAMYLHDIKPSVRRVHEGGIYGSLSLENRFPLMLEARLYLIQYFKKQGWSAHEIERDIATQYLKFFLRLFKTNRVMRTDLIRKSIAHARKGRRTFMAILINHFKTKLEKRFNRLYHA